MRTHTVPGKTAGLITDGLQVAGELVAESTQSNRLRRRKRLLGDEAGCIERPLMMR
jgi:hypothetical protein